MNWVSLALLVLSVNGVQISLGNIILSDLIMTKSLLTLIKVEKIYPFRDFQ